MTKRRTFSYQFKSRVAMEIINGHKSLAQASRDYQIKENVLRRWKAHMLETIAHAFAPKANTLEHKALTDQLAESQRLVGKLTLRLEIAKKTSHYLTRLPAESEL